MNKILKLFIGFLIDTHEFFFHVQFQTSDFGMDMRESLMDMREFRFDMREFRFHRIY